MYLLVTGDCGLIGSHVKSHHRERGHKLVADDNPLRWSEEKNIAVLGGPGVFFPLDDVHNPKVLANLPSGIDLICHTSAKPFVIKGYVNPLFNITHHGLGASHIYPVKAANLMVS